MTVEEIITQLLINKHKDDKVTVELAKEIQKETNEIMKDYKNKKPQSTFVNPRV